MGGLELDETALWLLGSNADSVMELGVFVISATLSSSLVKAARVVKLSTDQKILLNSLEMYKIPTYTQN